MSTTLTDQNILVLDAHGSGTIALLDTLGANIERIYAPSNQAKAIEVFEAVNPSIVIVAIDDKTLDGIDMISWVTEQNLPVAIIAAAYSDDVGVSAAAIRSGATDFLNLNLADTSTRLGKKIEHSLSLIKEQQQINGQNHPLFDEAQPEFIGSSQVMLEVSKLIINAAKSNASVFITGENGTGKEVCAQMIHQYSQRSQAELVTLNCAAIPNGLAESEMFGHVKGAFTGAVGDRTGVAKLANNGTLFLDEIGEMESNIQSKLLRFVQTGNYNPVGNSQTEQVDVRFICATNRDPNQQIADGTFRQDLFYRLNVIQIHLPPLRKRGHDILIIARRFLTQFASEENKPFGTFSLETEQLLQSYAWPGNIRELQNVIRNIVVLHSGEVVIPSMLPLAIIREKGERRQPSSAGNVSSKRQDMLNKLRESVHMLTNPSQVSSHVEEIKPLDDVIDECIKQAIERCNGNIAMAAQKLGVSSSTLYRKIKN